MKTKAIITILFMLAGAGPAGAIMWTEGYHQMIPGESYGESRIYNDVILDIYGGDISYLWAFNETTINWYDGEMGYFVTHDSSIANIYGGSVSITLGVTSDSMVNLYESSLINAFSSDENGVLNLYAYDILHQTSGGHYDDGWIEGKYISNNQSFHIDLIGDSFSHINVIPEPTTILLLGLGSMFVIRKRK